MKTIDLQTKILEELGKGDRFASQLYDALNLRSYQILWQVLGQLSAEGKVKTYFSDTPPSATLTYTLTEKPKSFPLILWRNPSLNKQT